MRSLFLDTNFWFGDFFFILQLSMCLSLYLYLCILCIYPTYFIYHILFQLFFPGRQPSLSIKKKIKNIERYLSLVFKLQPADKQMVMSDNKPTLSLYLTTFLNTTPILSHKYSNTNTSTLITNNINTYIRINPKTAFEYGYQYFLPGVMSLLFYYLNDLPLFHRVLQPITYCFITTFYYL